MTKSETVEMTLRTLTANQRREVERRRQMEIARQLRVMALAKMECSKTVH